MKKMLNFSAATAALLVVCLFTSCDLLDKADDVSFNTTLDHTFEITKSGEAQNVEYNTVYMLDATAENSDINKYKEKIKGFTVTKVSYQILNFSGSSASTFTGTIAFGDASASTASVAAAVTGLNLQTAATAGTVFELVYDPTDVDEIEAMLKSDKAVKIYLNGVLTQTPALFDVLVVLDVKVKANALD